MTPQTLKRPIQKSISVDEQYRNLSSQIASIQRRCRRGSCCESLLQSIHEALGCLPLSTEEYSRARCHVANAARYLASRENGAASYEFRMLAGLFPRFPNPFDSH